MAWQTGSEGLRKFLWQELKDDPNATLYSAKKRLQHLCDAAPGDAVSEQKQWLAEITELLDQYDEHTSLADLFSEKP